MPAILPDSLQAQKRNQRHKADSPGNPCLSQPFGAAAPNHGTQAAAHQGQSPAPGGAQQGPPPLGEGKTLTEAERGHHGAAGEGEEDIGTCRGWDDGGLAKQYDIFQGFKKYDGHVFLVLFTRSWRGILSCARPRSVGKSSLSSGKAQRPES